MKNRRDFLKAAPLAAIPLLIAPEAKATEAVPALRFNPTLEKPIIMRVEEGHREYFATYYCYRELNSNNIWELQISCYVDAECRNAIHTAIRSVDSENYGYGASERFLLPEGAVQVLPNAQVPRKLGLNHAVKLPDDWTDTVALKLITQAKVNTARRKFLKEAERVMIEQIKKGKTVEFIIK